MKLTVGTRGSRLSLVQTNFVIQRLKKEFPDLQVEVRIIKTIGDRITRKPLISIKQKGIFEKEIDKAVLCGDVDFAVHSMKDVPVIQHLKTTIAAVPERESPYDVLVSKEDVKLKEMPKEALIGTGSPRRMAQLLYLRPDLRVKSIRGNVETRVKKFKQGPYEGIILAEVGLQRLNMQGCITERLSLEDFTPAPGQGALAVVVREDKKEVIEVLKRIDHGPSMASVLAERAFIKEIGGGCKIPVGAIAQVQNNTLSLYASILSPDGKMRIQASKVGDPASPEKVGSKLAHELLEAGGTKLIERRRDLHER